MAQRSRPWLATLLLFATCTGAMAQWKPTQDVEFVIPFGLGGGADLFARTLIKIAQDEKMVPTHIVANNKPGGGTASGVGYVVSSRNKDPHTLVLINPQTQITPLRVPRTFGAKDLQPIMNFMLDDYLLAVKAGSPYASAADMVAAAKSRPRTISVGSAGTADDMAIALLEQATGTRFNLVRFNGGGEALTALLGGHVDSVAGNPIELMSQLQAKTIKGVGVFRPTRFEALADVPTLEEQGIKVTPFQMWRGVAIPKGAPREAAMYWEDVFARVARTPAFKSYIATNVATEKVLGTQDFLAFLSEQETIYKAALARIGGKP
ncbi:Tripartite tricarboxylate transporter family receptor [Variovorax sp. PBL-H6]|uniref:Bug family tripartite tricarboxylate transporter substrate binding protein n=1 Tax=Variovorax sp. PBL-H6 TaxID=434009 RepID=UPI001315C3FC|nr:tripartite tricarboxylate transporter substrate binding protein [Variovorax sp. PBL-H6]VTU39543.1 Tripartite tricarboxylate transporter family receptor [Variovorax sp. PBL-H6]